MKLTHPMTLIPLAILVIVVALLINGLLKRQPVVPSEDLSAEVTVVEDVDDPGAADEGTPDDTVAPDDVREIDTNQEGLKIEVLLEGTGDIAEDGNFVHVHYRGTLPDGTEFDSSYKRGVPFGFELGKGRVIQGWDLGVLGMRVGERRRLTIAPELGYGDRDLGTIPPNSTLIFEVELMDVR